MFELELVVVSSLIMNISCARLGLISKYWFPLQNLNFLDSFDPKCTHHVDTGCCVPSGLIDKKDKQNRANGYIENNRRISEMCQHNICST